MGKREGFALIAIPVLVAAIVWLPHPVFLAVVAVAVLLAADEMLAMARTAGFDTGRWLALLLTAGVMASSWIWGAPASAASAVMAVTVLPMAQLSRRRAPEGSLAGAAIAVLAVLYFGLCGACLGWLRVLPDNDVGWRLLLFFLGTIWVGDSGAYYVGKNFGKRKMSPRISPNKTLEGLMGSVVTTFAAAAVFKVLFGLPFSWAHTAALAAVLAAAAPIGDLVESQFKRDAGVKDSSTLIPGHGGLFDRTDSLLFSAPPVLGYLLAVGLLG